MNVRLPPGATLAALAVFVIESSATGAATSGVISVLLRETGSSTLVLTDAVTCFCELSAESETRTRIVVTAEAALAIVPSAQVTVCPEIVQPAGAAIGVICEGIVAIS